jgi:hypothetical protein
MDEADLTQQREEAMHEARLRAATKPLEPGEPGDCDFCGEWSGRLVRGACAPCRDKRKLP